VLPWLQRRPRQGGEWWPQLYVPGVALGAFERARRGLLGDGAPLSAAALVRLKASWQLESEAWPQRRRDDLAVVDVWAAGVSVNAGLEDSKAALRVRIGALTDGQKVVRAVESGPRAATEAWGAGLRALRARGLQPWRCTMADGHRGIWAAVAEPPPTAAAPRCWNHRLTTVLEAIPHTQQPQARTRRCAMPSAASQAACEPLRTQFDTRERQGAPKAVARLAQDWDRLVTFSQCPREPGRHWRTTNVVESPCAAARRRTSAANRFKKVASATALIGKRLQVAARTVRRLHAPELLPAVYAGAKDVEGLKPNVRNHQEVAA
jgi:putative transposase